MQFPNTHWSLLAQATLNGDAGGQQALESLCRQYWKPVRDFIRFRGFPEADAEDLTQVFLVRLCERSVWRRAEAARGRFRSFLLGALTHFLADELDRRNTQKRGGQIEFAPFRVPKLSGDLQRAMAKFRRRPRGRGGRWQSSEGVREVADGSADPQNTSVDGLAENTILSEAQT